MWRAYDQHWSLDPNIVFLNHGSFGACPIAVRARQAEWQLQLEREPVRFFVRELPGLLTSAREQLAEFVGADAEGVAFVPNATHGVNTVVRSLRFQAGDELLTTNHAYGACKNAMAYVAERAGAKLVIAKVPFPIQSEGQVVDAILGAVTERTRLAMLDHITSPTGLVFPIERIVKELAARGVDTLVDGAHAPGMVDLDIGKIGAAYYTGNCHKWLCTVRGAAFLHVREDRRDLIQPLSISHGATVRPPGVSAYRAQFDWTGTDDPSGFLSIPESIRFLGGMLEGGWPALRAELKRRVIEARGILCDALKIAPPAPDSMIGSLVALPLMDGNDPNAQMQDPLAQQLFEEENIEVPVFPWPKAPKRLIRVSAHLYNRREDYERLAAALTRRLG